MPNQANRFFHYWIDDEGNAHVANDAPWKVEVAGGGGGVGHMPRFDLENGVDGKLDVIPEKPALIVVDMQNDFVDLDGRLPVPGAEHIIPFIIKTVKGCRKFKIPVYWSYDYHPADHKSFVENGGPFPAHCINGTEGANIVPDLMDIMKGEDILISKGKNRHVDQLSAFGTPDNRTPLSGSLIRKGIRSVLIVGVALEYCIKETAISAVEYGYKTVVSIAGTRAVDHNNAANTITELREHGVIVL